VTAPVTITRRAATLVWTALLVVPFSFLALAATVRWSAARSEAGPAAFWIAVAVAALNVTLSRVLPGRLRPSQAGRQATVFARLVVAWALCEAAALFPLVAWIVTGDPRLVGVFAVGLLALLLLYPSDHRWASLAPPEPGIEEITGRIR
jgi:phosphotransferase system  glucose/maltose/N-acetylglucosamine-specific IIC component